MSRVTRGGFGRIFPTGVTGDVARLVAFVAACATDGITAVAGKGQWYFDTAPGLGGIAYWPSFSRTVFDDGASIRMDMSGSGGAGQTANSAFYSTWTNGTNTATFHASPSANSQTLDVDMTAGTFTKGSWIVLADSAITNTAEVLQIIDTPVNVSGTRYTFTVHRNMRFPWVANGTTTIQDGTPPQHIYIDLNGAEISGTGHRVGEIGFAQRCWVRGLNISRNYGSANWGWSFDVGGWANEIHDAFVDGGATMSGAMLALESNVDSTMTRVVARAGTTGLFLPNAIGCSVDNYTIERASFGVYLVPAGGVTDITGHQDCHFHKGVISGSTTNGFAAYDGVRLDVDGLTIVGGVTGFNLTLSSLSGPTDVKVRGLHVTGTSGVAISCLSSSAKFSDVVLENIGTYGLTTDGSTNDLEFSSIRFRQTSAGTGPWTIGAGKVKLKGLELDSNFNGGWAGNTTAASLLRIEDARCDSQGTGTKTFLDMTGVSSGPRVEIRNVRLTGTWTFGIYAAHANSAVVKIGDGVDFDAAATPFSYDSTAFSSRFTVAANGATAVDLSGTTPKILCSKHMVLRATRQVTTGTPPAASPLTEITAANAARFISSAGDTVNYTVQAG